MYVIYEFLFDCLTKKFVFFFLICTVNITFPSLAFFKFCVPKMTNDDFTIRGYNEHANDNVYKIEFVDAVQALECDDGNIKILFGGGDDKYNAGRGNSWFYDAKLTLAELAETPKRGVFDLLCGCMVYNYLLYR